MFFIYVDESGTPNPTKVLQEDGSRKCRERLYVLAAVSLFDKKWNRFEHTLNDHKSELIRRTAQRAGTDVDLELAHCEVKSTYLRQVKVRQEHPVLAHLSPEELLELSNLYYRQLRDLLMHVFVVVIDKEALLGDQTQADVQQMAWKLLVERVEFFLRTEYPTHMGILITDDVSKQQNQALAMEHARLLRRGTGVQRLPHIVEMPLFVRSELSNGVQLADLVAYNFYRAFKYAAFDYEWYLKVLPYVWVSDRAIDFGLEGLKVWPKSSDLAQHVPEIGKVAAKLRFETFGGPRIRKGWDPRRGSQPR